MIPCEEFFFWITSIKIIFWLASVEIEKSEKIRVSKVFNAERIDIGNKKKLAARSVKKWEIGFNCNMISNYETNREILFLSQQKVDPSNYDQYLGSGGSSASGAPRDPPRGPPAQPRGGPPPMQPAAAAPPRAPPARGGGLMASIRQGTTLQKAAPARKPPPSRGGGLLDAIRSGATLKKASDRELAPRVIEYNSRDQTMQAITKGKFEQAKN